MAEGGGFEIEKEELRGVREEADQQADSRNRQLGYCEVITQHVEFHDLAVETQTETKAVNSRGRVELLVLKARMDWPG